jgi:hypothetical protein
MPTDGGLWTLAAISSHPPELARHGTKFVVAGNAVKLRYPPKRPPPARLVEAARGHKEALRALVVASAAIAGELQDRLAQLAEAPAPAGYLRDRWLGAVRGAVAFSEQWTEAALQLGWSPLDLFGLHPVAPAARYDCKGLAWLLERDAEVVEITAEAATIRMRSGSLLRFYEPPASTGAVLPWI